VDRRDAANLANTNARKREEEKAKQKKDSRNLYLLRQGLIMNNSPAYTKLSQHDRTLRRKLEMESKAKIANPNLSVSRTRISVHNMPLTTTEQDLRKMIDTNCKLKDRLLQVKVVRSKDRVGADGKMRSKGFGFLEMADHDDALTVIETMNNSPKFFGPQKRPILQFAWTDVQVIKKILRRREASKMRVERLEDSMADTKSARKREKVRAVLSDESGKKRNAGLRGCRQVMK